MLAGDDLNSRTLAMIDAADWIIFVMLDVAPESAPMSTAVKRLLGDYPDLIKGQKTVVFALNAFVAQDGSADFNGDTVVNTIDFVAFLNAFVAGC